MMYKVMIVDDETIILSGIKSLLDWEKNDCELVATARNGQDALEQIRRMPVDIVLVDLNMPVMDGITLMKTVNEEFPDIVFIVLTNLEEFELARQAMKYRAIDYLVKSRLEASRLEEVISRAKKERGTRTYRTVADAANHLKFDEQRKVVSKVIQEAVFFRGGKQREAYIEILKDSGVLSDYGYFYIPFEFTVSGEEAGGKRRKKQKDGSSERNGRQGSREYFWKFLLFAGRWRNAFHCVVCLEYLQRKRRHLGAEKGNVWPEAFQCGEKCNTDRMPYFSYRSL